MEKQLERPTFGCILILLLAAGTFVALSATVVRRAFDRRGSPQDLPEPWMLNSAMKAYKEQHGAFPPCMGAASDKDREAQFLEHIRKAFPQFHVANYAELRDAIRKPHSDYNFADGNGRIQPLDLDTLDQAEAMVFWLGGFPTPVDQNGRPAWRRKLIGFHAGPARPFALDRNPDDKTGAWLRLRGALLFDFDDSRLTDQDDDGWLEYVPTSKSESADGKAPYVYFDSALYDRWQSTATPAPFAGYPVVGARPGNEQSAALRDRWGLALPYAGMLPSGGNPPWPHRGGWLWINPMSVQIISAGLDGRYCSSKNANQLRIAIYPSGTTYYQSDGFTAAHPDYDPDERDNLTNFSPGMLANQRP